MSSKWQSFEVDLIFNGVKLVVSGTWYKGHNGIYSTFNDPLGEPPDPSEVEIETILVDESDVLDLIHYEYLQDIETEVIQLLDN